MKKYYSLILSSLLLFNCSDSAPKKNLVEEGEMSEINTSDTCACDELKDSATVYYKDKTPYTGVCVYNYPNTENPYMVKGVMNGKLHGKVTYYDQSGEVIMEELYEGGRKKRNGNSAPITCECSELDIQPIPGSTVKRAFLDEIPFTGTCIKHYPESDQKYMDASYKNGVLDGFTTYFDKTGVPLYMEKYERGELLKVIHDSH